MLTAVYPENIPVIQKKHTECKPQCRVEFSLQQRPDTMPQSRYNNTLSTNPLLLTLRSRRSSEDCERLKDLLRDHIEIIQRPNRGHRDYRGHTEVTQRSHRLQRSHRGHSGPMINKQQTSGHFRIPQGHVNPTKHTNIETLLHLHRGRNLGGSAVQECITQLKGPV